MRIVVLKTTVNRKINEKPQYDFNYLKINEIKKHIINFR